MSTKNAKELSPEALREAAKATLFDHLKKRVSQRQIELTEDTYFRALFLEQTIHESNYELLNMVRMCFFGLPKGFKASEDTTLGHLIDLMLK